MLLCFYVFMNILGIDYGSKNIGLALADMDLRIPYPLTSVRNDKTAKAEIKKIINEHEVKKIVIGLPMHTFGNEGVAAEAVRAFGRTLEDLGVPIIFEDERFSSAMVKKMMAEDKNYDKDAIEAAVILESYLAKNKS